MKESNKCKMKWLFMKEKLKKLTDEKTYNLMRFSMNIDRLFNKYQKNF